MMVRAFAELDWRAVKLVVFDVDGTLYRQRTLRLLMQRELLQHCIMTATTMPARVLSTYRSIRETLGDAEVEGFERLLVARTARETGCSHDTVGPSYRNGSSTAHCVISLGVVTLSYLNFSRASKSGEKS